MTEAIPIAIIPMTPAQKGLQKAQLPVTCLPAESIFVEHHGFDSPSMVHAMYLVSLYVKGKTHGFFFTLAHSVDWK